MKTKVAIVTPLKPTYSETFLRAHIELLPFQMHHFYALPKMGYHPIYDGEGRPLSSDRKWLNYLETGIDRLFGETGVGYFFRKKAMIHYFKKHQISAVLAEYGPTATYILDVCKACKLPLIVHFHGRDAYHYQTIARFGKKYTLLFEYASAIVSVSRDMSQQLITLGAPEKKIILNPCSPNERFSAQSSINKPTVFLTVGRFAAKKGPEYTIRAFAEVLKQIPAARLLMVGEGELWDTCKELSIQLGVAEKIEFLGSRTPDQVAELFHQARVFVQHSRRAEDGDSEGTPVSILEAMKSGLPIVSTRHAGIKDVVLEGETGFLVDEGDWKGMAEAMLKLAQDPNLAAEMGKKGNARVEAHYTMEQHIQRLADAILAAIKNS